MAAMREQQRNRKHPHNPHFPKSVTRSGDVWRLGRHRLLCGDATDPIAVARLLAGKTPLLMVTDPPYGVSYDPTWRVRPGEVCNRRMGRIANDHRFDWAEAYKLFAGDVAYIWHAGIYAREVANSLGDLRLGIRAQIIWCKRRMVFGRGHYHWQHEPCWYAVRKGATAKWRGDHKQRTVWQIDSAGDDAATDHSTQKPLECMARPIRNHGDRGDLVYDPFVGSGTTIIAAEQLGRSCYAIEIDPLNCDIAIQRWQNFTGKKATRDSRTAVKKRRAA